MPYQDNVEDVLGEFDRLTPRRTHHLLEIKNVADYARYLHDRQGFSVLSDKVILDMIERRLRQLVALGNTFTDQDIEEALRDASDEYVEWLQRLTSEMRPPIRAGGPQRPAHPGHWADRTTNLASSFERIINGKHFKQYSYEGTVYAEE